MATFHYVTGEEVREGDVVLLYPGSEHEAQGLVARVLIPGTKDAEDYACPNDGGVLVEEFREGPAGLTLFSPADTTNGSWREVAFARRARR